MVGCALAIGIIAPIAKVNMLRRSNVASDAMVNLFFKLIEHFFNAISPA
jgi:hypothetical protein